MHREMKKEKRLTGGMTAMEKARLNLALLEDEKEAEATGTPAREPFVRPTLVVEEEVENSDTEDDEDGDGDEDEDEDGDERAPDLAMLRMAMDPESGNLLDVAKLHFARVKPTRARGALRDLPTWPGVWEDLRAVRWVCFLQGTALIFWAGGSFRNGTGSTDGFPWIYCVGQE